MAQSEEKKVCHYLGQNIEELTREELIKAFRHIVENYMTQQQRLFTIEKERVNYIFN